jgi:hypothetical protein
LPAVLNAIDQDTDTILFSYIPNGRNFILVEEAQDFLNQRKIILS